MRTFKTHGTMTPAQKKLAAAVACLALIMGASLLADALLSARYPGDGVAAPAGQQAEQPAGDAGGSKGAEGAQDDDEPNPFTGLAPGKTYDAGDLTLANDSGYVISEEEGADLIGDLRSFLTASDAAYEGGRFAVTGFVSTSGTGAATFFLTSDVGGAKLVRAARGSQASPFSFAVAADKAEFDQLMDKALKGFGGDPEAEAPAPPAEDERADGGE